MTELYETVINLDASTPFHALSNESGDDPFKKTCASSETAVYYKEFGYAAAATQACLMHLPEKLEYKK